MVAKSFDDRVGQNYVSFGRWTLIRHAGLEEPALQQAAGNALAVAVQSCDEAIEQMQVGQERNTKKLRAARGTEQKGILFVALTFALVGLCVFVLFFDTLTWKRVSEAPMRAFQNMAGGLGMGAIAAPVWNFINFDPRLSSVDDSVMWPIAGGYPYGPDRTATVTYFRESPKNQLILLEQRH